MPCWALGERKTLQGGWGDRAGFRRRARPTTSTEHLFCYMNCSWVDAASPKCRNRGGDRGADKRGSPIRWRKGAMGCDLGIVAAAPYIGEVVLRPETSTAHQFCCQICEQFFRRPRHAGSRTERGISGAPFATTRWRVAWWAGRWAMPNRLMRGSRVRDDRTGWRSASTMTP
jgi:hypothetical protein